MISFLKELFQDGDQITATSESLTSPALGKILGQEEYSRLAKATYQTLNDLSQEINRVRSPGGWCQWYPTPEEWAFELERRVRVISGYDYLRFPLPKHKECLPADGVLLQVPHNDTALVISRNSPIEFAVQIGGERVFSVRVKEGDSRNCEFEPASPSHEAIVLCMNKAEAVRKALRAAADLSVSPEQYDLLWGEGAFVRFNKKDGSPNEYEIFSKRLPLISRAMEGLASSDTPELLSPPEGKPLSDWRQLEKLCDRLSWCAESDSLSSGKISEKNAPFYRRLVDLRRAAILAYCGPEDEREARLEKLDSAMRTAEPALGELRQWLLQQRQERTAEWLSHKAQNLVSSIDGVIRQSEMWRNPEARTTQGLYDWWELKNLSWSIAKEASREVLMNPWIPEGYKRALVEMRTASDLCINCGALHNAHQRVGWLKSAVSIAQPILEEITRSPVTKGHIQEVRLHPANVSGLDLLVDYADKFLGSDVALDRKENAALPTARRNEYVDSNFPLRSIEGFLSHEATRNAMENMAPAALGGAVRDLRLGVTAALDNQGMSAHERIQIAEKACRNFLIALTPHSEQIESALAERRERDKERERQKEGQVSY